MGDSYISYREENGSINISEDVISGIVRTAVRGRTIGTMGHWN